MNVQDAPVEVEKNLENNQRSNIKNLESDQRLNVPNEKDVQYVQTEGEKCPNIGQRMNNN